MGTGEWSTEKIRMRTARTGPTFLLKKKKSSEAGNEQRVLIC